MIPTLKGIIWAHPGEWINCNLKGARIFGFVYSHHHLDSKGIKPVNPKGSQPWIFIVRTDAEAPIFWPPDVKSQLIGKDPDAGKDWDLEKKGVAEDETLDLITHSLDMSLSKLQEVGKDRETWHTAVQGVTKSRTWLSNWTTTTTPHAITIQDYMCDEMLQSSQSGDLAQVTGWPTSVSIIH